VNTVYADDTYRTIIDDVFFYVSFSKPTMRTAVVNFTYSCYVCRIRDDPHTFTCAGDLVKHSVGKHEQYPDDAIHNQFYASNGSDLRTADADEIRRHGDGSHRSRKQRGVLSDEDKEAAESVRTKAGEKPKKQENADKVKKQETSEKAKKREAAAEAKMKEELEAAKKLKIEEAKKEVFEASKKVMKEIKRKEAQDIVRRDIVAAGMMSPEASVAQAAAVELDKRNERRLKAGLGKVKSSGRTFQEELDPEKLDMNTPSKRETGARILYGVVSHGRKTESSLDGGGEGEGGCGHCRNEKEEGSSSHPRLCRRVYKKGGDCEQKEQDSPIEQQCQSSSDHYSPHHYVL